MSSSSSRLPVENPKPEDQPDIVWKGRSSAEDSRIIKRDHLSLPELKANNAAFTKQNCELEMALRAVF